MVIYTGLQLIVNYINCDSTLANTPVVKKGRHIQF